MSLARQIPRWLVLSASLAVGCLVADAHALSRRACRRACTAQLTACAYEATPALRRGCRRAVIRACRNEGVAVCATATTTTTTATTTTSTASSATTTTLIVCDPSYPTLCLPHPPPNLNCDDIGATNFPVIGSDPHGLDADNDGFGCEP